MTSNDATLRPSALPALTAQLLPQLQSERSAAIARVQTLDDAIRDAQAWDHRRAAKLDRDRRCYRLGAALEPQGGLDLDDVFVTGFDVLGAHALVLLVAVALKAPPLTSETDLKKQLARMPAGRLIRGWGVWARWHWLARLYHEEVTAFENGPHGRDPDAPWRPKPPRKEQLYLALELGRYLQVVTPAFATRGDAHDWLLRLEGNPRFRECPELPPIPGLDELDL